MGGEKEDTYYQLSASYIVTSKISLHKNTKGKRVTSSLEFSADWFNTCFY